jgi:hypothetical protein
MRSSQLRPRHRRQIGGALTAGIVAIFVLYGPEPAASQTQITCTVKSGCDDLVSHPHRRIHSRSVRHRRARHALRAARVTSSGTVIGGRPSGCPYDYCGCGLRKHLGLSDKRLNLAWNWTRVFPRIGAQAGAAAVRHHHVMLLERQVSGSRWVVRDYNSGNGLSRIHERDVRGYVFVDPSVRGRLAMARF